MGEDRYRHGGGKGPHPIKVRCPRCQRVLGFRPPRGVGTWACDPCRRDVVFDSDQGEGEGVIQEGHEHTV